ncbi:hypothetical protein AB0M42_24525 [Streptomyces sp. NPDC051784]|uniref:hypothetical protein n=1 Tax=Streptomyces sp. NPDC051784 TaxID=3155805 RepID=UPI00343BDBDC
MGIRGAVVDEKRETGARPNGHGGTGEARGCRVTADVAMADVSPADETAPGRTSRNPEPSNGPVFVDATGRRGRTWRRAGTITAICCACYATTLVASLVGGDSTAPFLRLPRAMGLDPDATPGTAEGDGRTPSPATEQGGGATGKKPRPATTATVAPEPRGASADPAAVPLIDPVPSVASTEAPVDAPSPAPGSRGGTPEPSAPATGTEGGTGTKGPGAGARPDSPAPAPSEEGTSTEGPDGEGTSGARGPLGTLVGGLLDGLLGSG